MKRDIWLLSQGSAWGKAMKVTAGNGEHKFVATLTSSEEDLTRQQSSCSCASLMVKKIRKAGTCRWGRTESGTSWRRSPWDLIWVHDTATAALCATSCPWQGCWRRGWSWRSYLCSLPNNTHKLHCSMVYSVFKVFVHIYCICVCASNSVLLMWLGACACRRLDKLQRSLNTGSLMVGIINSLKLYNHSKVI